MLLPWRYVGPLDGEDGFPVEILSIWTDTNHHSNVNECGSGKGLF